MHFIALDAIRCMVNLPPISSASVFKVRRARVAERMRTLGVHATGAFAAGWARPRNFAHNHFPFRAESHFLYLVGQHIEGAVLLLDAQGEAHLYMEPQPPDMALWAGRAPSLAEWSARLDLPVLPLEDLQVGAVAVLPPQDEATAAWLSGLFDRELEAQAGPELTGEDARLATCLIDERLVKDTAALAQMRWAAELSARAHVAGMCAGRWATREGQVRAAMESLFIEAGVSPAYTSIVTTHGEVLHAERSDGNIEPGNLVLCDVGAESPEGFAADITRTWPARGRFSASQRAVYQAVLTVQKRAVAAARAGVHYADLHRAAVSDMGQALLSLGILRHRVEDCVESGAVSVFFPHGLGHSLGLDVHDLEDLGQRAGYDEATRRSIHGQGEQDPILRYLRLSRVLTPNMVVTIEPGFYQVPLLLERARRDPLVGQFINWDRLTEFGDVLGIRIEDDVLIGENEPCVLSAGVPKEVAEIEAIMKESSPGPATA
jgi:Xaa-Pro aminopeptidase